MTTRYRLLLYILTPPAVGTYVVHHELRALEEKYPALPADDTTCSLALRTPTSPSTQHSPHIDIYSARIPLSSLPSATAPITPEGLQSPQAHQTLSTRWAQALVGSRILRWEGSVFGLFSSRGFQPGDIGLSEEEFGPLPVNVNANVKEDRNQKRQLLNGGFIVERPPSQDGNPYGLLVSWDFPDDLRVLFEKIARWGYPWRFMSGGRHEMSVSKPYFVSGREGEEEEGWVVDVRFSSAHDYEIVPAEGGLEGQKTIPEWTVRLHRGFARLVLDRAVGEWVGGGGIDVYR
ncbi:hypothetical protein BJX76DRAFT_359540 [Aspergillus varians]